MLKPHQFVRTLFAALLASLSVAPAAVAADAGVGTIEGRVQNARTGEYMERARLQLAGTTQETFTDADGFYRFARVAPGEATIEAFFTGLPPETIRITVAPGVTVQRDIVFGGVAAAERDSTVKLAAFVVGASREMAASAIAINEQRFAPNIKNVLATDEFGFVPEGNAAEFLKFLPGITIESSGGNSREVSINGAPAANVPITVEGFSMASASVGNVNTSRTVAMDMVSVNNVARIEVEYTPTPESQGAALAGSVNMVPRSAFERSRPVFNGSVFVMMRSNEHSFKPTPGPLQSPSRKFDPGFDFSYVAPINQRFGFTLSGGTSTNFSPEPMTQTVWRGASAATNGAAFPDTTPDRPYLTQFSYRDGTKVTTRNSVGATLDFRLTRNDRLSLGFQHSYFHLYATNQNLAFVISRVLPGDFSVERTRSAPGQAQLQPSNLMRDRHNRTAMPTLVWRHDGPVWKGDLGLGVSTSTNANRDIDKGAFNSTTGFRRNLTITFEDMMETRPRAITVIDNATGAIIDPFAIEGKSFNTGTAIQNNTVDRQRTAYANLGRAFPTRVPFRLKAGLHLRQSARDNRSTTSVYTFLGPDGSAATDESSAPFLDSVYGSRRGVFGLPPLQGTSPFLAWQRYQATPGQFTVNQNNEYRSTVTSSKFAEELVSAAYIRGDTSFLANRLKLTGGVRAEQTNIDAQGPLTDPTRNYQRDAQGRLILAGGRPVPIIASTTSVDYSRLTFIERGAQASKEYLRLFPSLNASFQVRENLIARAGIYRSVGRPDFNQYAGGLTLPDSESVPSQANRIIVSNVGIKAWSATTTNVRLEYYFEGVGQISLNAFRRDFENFFGATRFPATPEFLALYDVDPGVYGAFDVETQYNVPGIVRMEGSSLNYKQALTFLPPWARGVQVFANASSQRRTGALVGNAGFNFYPRSASWGVSLTRQKFQARLNWNYRGERRGAATSGASIGPNTFTWVPERLTLDAQAEYTFFRRFAVFGSLRNAANAPEDTQIYGPLTPEAARFRNRIDYGALWTFGVRGTF
ncbi:MAG: carboxypeptidase regulatory-like domain-containing protein [Opitutaceae bacterium]|nr:carboxypeptidase regulatory-like domain-containing protein [Opitutaceae bacterium]